MADRPYRTYKAGRGGAAAPPDPDTPLLEPQRRGAIELPAPGGGSGGSRDPRTWIPRARPPRGLRSWLLAILGVITLLLVIWIGLGLLALRSALAEANERLDPRAEALLVPNQGSALSEPTTILVIGVDAFANSDSLQLIRLDPPDRLVATLAIPRDLRVRVPGYGDQKINSAYANGGAALTLRAVSDYTGLPIDHVVVVEFDAVKQVVDALGGIEVDNPNNVRSIFEATQHEFLAGPIRLDGEQALAYSRIRRNILDTSDSDITRGQRQQQVIQAIRGKLLSPSGTLRFRQVAEATRGTLATDITLGELVPLAWVDRRSARRLRCNLGGTPAPLDGQDVLLPDGAGNRRVLGEFLGNQAVRSAPTRSGFAAVCRES